MSVSAQFGNGSPGRFHAFKSFNMTRKYHYFDKLDVFVLIKSAHYEGHDDIAESGESRYYIFNRENLSKIEARIQRENDKNRENESPVDTITHTTVILYIRAYYVSLVSHTHLYTYWRILNYTHR